MAFYQNGWFRKAGLQRFKHHMYKGKNENLTIIIA